MVRMWVQLKRLCVSCVWVICSELGKRATSEAGSLCKGVMDVVIFQLHHRLNQ